MYGAKQGAGREERAGWWKTATGLKWETGVTQTHLSACLGSEAGGLLKFNSSGRDAGAFVHLSAGGGQKRVHSYVG